MSLASRLSLVTGGFYTSVMEVIKFFFLYFNTFSTCLSLIPGGGSGIGRAVCQLFAKEGASVAVVGSTLSTVEETVYHLRDTAKKEGRIGATFHPFEVDVSNSSQVDSLFRSLEDVFTRVPPLSILVNGAGLTRDALLLKQTEENFEQVLNVNLKACVFRLT